jgi:broad specificity polyphosphatase/5'/3'-nucleotidase SurE|tara:strand:- start:325 stop:558 length:234 start_codon:yes stop_codon:yes gene_type:complete
MIIGTYNPITGEHVRVNVPVTEEQILQWQMGTPASVVFSHLKQWERDVILSGMNAGDWDDWETESKASEVDTHTQAA